jgi:hypothetical protein
MRFARQLGRERRALAPRPGEDYAGNRLAIRDGASALEWEIL